MKELEYRKSHPKGLYTLFATEMWERFSYYGMRSLLVLYLTATVVNGGFGLDETAALEVYAIFTGLVYLTPILGGWVSDNLLGQRKTVYVGGLVMAIGQFFLASGAFMSDSLDPATRGFLSNFGLGVLIIGNGFFKPNISTIVGDFYNDNDPMKDSAFNIFYLGINLGAILGTFIAGGLGENVDWGWGFLTAGIGMVLSVIWLNAHENTLEHNGLPPKSSKDIFRIAAKDWRDIIIWAIGLVVSTLLVMVLWRNLPDSITGIISIVGFIAIFGALAYIVFKGTNGSSEWSRMGVIIVLALFNIVFWAGFEQAGGTFSLFARDNTNRKMAGFSLPDFFNNIDLKYLGILAGTYILIWIWSIYIKIYSEDDNKIKSAKGIGKISGISSLVFIILAIIIYASTGPEMPATWFQNVNSLAILIGAPLFAGLWLWLDKKGWNPRTPIKFALGLAFASLAFWVMTQASNAAEGGGLVSPLWLVTVYVLLTIGELMLSPIGLSMITKLAPAKLVSVVMGLWMASFAAGNYIAGMLKSILEKYDFELYPFIMTVMLGSTILLLLISPLLNKAMKGIH